MWQENKSAGKVGSFQRGRKNIGNIGERQTMLTQMHWET